jgi:PD-(D/E)XK nuclease superfamily
MSAHADGFRPSHFPALSACIHHQSIQTDNQAATRGTGTHGRIPQVITADTVNYEEEEPPVQFAAAWVISRLMEGWRIVGTEIPVDILDAEGSVITTGTLDLLLERNRSYQIVDWKTGDKNGYTSQMAGYISAVQDLYPKGKIYGSIVYLDLCEPELVNLTSMQCFEIVNDLWDKWNNKEYEPYTITPYCDYCAHRGDCPAWRAEAAGALSTVAELGIPAGSALVTAKVDALKNDPTKLEEFILAWERAKTLVEGEWKLKEALKAHMETGFKADYHILVHVKDMSSIIRSIDPEQFLEKVAREIGFMNAAPALKVDPDKAREVWQKFYGYGDDAKLPVEVTETTVDKSGYSYIRAKGRPGVGDARKKRKELE